ncbi:MAG: hypothetical protein KGL39_42285 [Patescibacteria group bacterium]|nr:hypothetical protein [Patescibacteria group bacterium]
MALTRTLARLRKPHLDPVTQETLSPSEYASLLASKVIRTWRVFFALQLLTVVWWISGQALTDWNYLWSDLAIVVEQAMGIALFSLSRRDSAVLRRLLAIEQSAQQSLERSEHNAQTLQEVTGHLCALLERGKEDSAELAANTELTAQIRDENRSS